MGQTTSTQQVQNGGYGDSALSNAQISDNIERLFRSQNTTRHDSVQIRKSSKGMSTSAVEVDTIINDMRGGNKSRVAAVPKRQRYGLAPKVKNNNQLDTEDLRYVRNMVYQQSMRGGTGSPKTDAGEEPKLFNQLNQQQDSNTSSDSSRNIQRSDSNEETNEHDVHIDQENIHDDTVLSQTSDVDPDELESEQDKSQISPNVHKTPVVKQSPIVDQSHVVNQSPSVDPNGRSSPGLNKSPLKESDKALAQPQFDSNVSNLVDPQIVALDQQRENNQESNLVGGNNKNSIDKEIQLIRKIVNNTIRQRGGNDDEKVKNDNDSRVLEEILSEDGLADIRANLTKHGVLLQKGGKLDPDLETFRDTMLSNNENAEGFSDTSPDPSNYIAGLRGGAKEEDKKKASKEAKDEDTEDEEDLDDDDDEDDDDDDDDDDDEDGDENGDDEDGVLSSSQNGGTQDEDEDENDSSSSNSDSDSNSKSTSSDSSESEVSNGSITIMHQSIDRAMDKKKNASKYLKDNNYTVTSNSERDYKINNKHLYSSQTSDAYNSIGSDYLDKLRNRDRLA